MKMTGSPSLSALLNILTTIALIACIAILCITVAYLFFDIPMISGASYTVETIKIELDEAITNSIPIMASLILLFINIILILIVFKRILKQLIDNNLFSAVILKALMQVSFLLIPLAFIKNFFNFMLVSKLLEDNPVLNEYMTIYFQLFDQGIISLAIVLFLVAHVYKEAIKQYEENKLTI